MTTNPYTLFFGDLHNHNALGYGLGSLERSIDIARTHLDFFAFTGHSSWHDMPTMEGGRESNWLKGFAKLEEAWPKVQQLTADANIDGNFASFLGFEWHSSYYGDQCVILPDDGHPLVFPDNIGDLRSYCANRNGLMIPHHLAYKQGHRGVNWEVFQESHSPVVEIYSEHGNGLCDRCSHPYFNHSMGGRVTSNTAQAALDDGLEFGFVASSDTHRGFPGAFGEGLLGVWSNDLTRRGIFEAIKSRRTIALTGDKIHAYFQVEGKPLGSAVLVGPTAEVDFDVRARDEIDVIELIVNGQIQQRFFPGGDTAKGPSPGNLQVRVEWGWGPWADMDLDRICDWDFSVRLVDGNLHAVTPCLRSGPFDENRRHRFDRNEHAVDVKSFTARKGAFRDNPNQQMVLEISGDKSTLLEVEMRTPEKLSYQTSLGQLEDSADIQFTGPFPAESILLHRPVASGESSLSGRANIDLRPGHNYVYLHVRQRNGQEAWASPVFVERK